MLIDGLRNGIVLRVRAETSIIRRNRLENLTIEHEAVVEDRSNQAHDKQLDEQRRRKRNKKKDYLWMKMPLICRNI